MKKMVLTLLLVWAQAADATPARAGQQATHPAMLDSEEVAVLCMSVAEKMHGAGERRLAFDNQIRRWAGITHTREPDDADVAKIAAFWAANAPQLTCTQLAFTIPNGHLWKLAIERNNEDFLEMALIDWHLTPNDLDCTGETALDYTERRLLNESGTSRGRALRQHRDLLLEHGAMRASELPAEAKTLPSSCRG